MYDVSRDVDELLNDPFPVNHDDGDDHILDQEHDDLSDDKFLQQPVKSGKSAFRGVFNFTKKFINLIAFIAAVLVAGIMLLVIFADELSIYFPCLNFESPKERFVHAEMVSAEKFADSVSSLYSKWYARNCTETSGYDAEMHLLLSDQVANQFNNYLPEESHADFSWIDDLSINLDINRDRYLYQFTAVSQLEDDKISSMNGVLDMSQSVLFLQLPELSDSYLHLDLNEYFKEFYSRSIHQYAVDQDTYTHLIAALPSEQVLNQLLIKYSSLLINQIEDIEQYETILNSDAISIECTALSATLSEKQIIDMYIQLLQTASKDELIIGLVEDIAKYGGLDPDSERESFSYTVTGYIGELQIAARKANEKNYLEWIIYVDDQNNLLGRRILVSDVESEFFTYTISEGDGFAYYYNLFDAVCVEGFGSRHEIVMDSEFDVYLDGVYSFHITVDNLNFIHYLHGNLSGEILIKPTKNLIQQWYGKDFDSQLAFLIDIKTTRKKSDFHIDILKDDFVITEISFHGQDGSGKTFELPDSDIDVMDQSAFIQWLESIHFNKLKSNLHQANIPPDLTSILQAYLDELLLSLQG